MCTQAEPQTGQIIQPVPREQRYSSCCSFGYVHTEVWTDRCTLVFLHIFLESWFTSSPLWLVSRFHVAPEQWFLQQWQTRHCGGAGQWGVETNLSPALGWHWFQRHLPRTWIQGKDINPEAAPMRWWIRINNNKHLSSASSQGEPYSLYYCSHDGLWNHSSSK